MDEKQVNTAPAEEPKEEPAQEAAPETNSEQAEAQNMDGKEENNHIEISTNEKAYGDALRKLLGLSAEDELTDLDGKIGAIEQRHAAMIAKARDQVISAELKALSGYDTKLLDRLLDRSKITFDDSGKVSGVEEAVKLVEAEFPAVKLKEEHKPFIPVNPSVDDAGKKMSLQEAMTYANAHPGVDIDTLI